MDINQRLDQQLVSAQIIGQAIIAYNEKLEGQGIEFKIEYTSRTRVLKKGTRIVIHRLGGLSGEHIKEIMDLVDIVKGNLTLTNGGDVVVTFPDS